MALLQPFALINTKEFTWVPETRTFVAEESDFNVEGYPRFMDRLHRVYDDACDVGFSLVSEKTGKVVVVVLNRIEKDNEGDVLSWEFVPAQLSERRRFSFTVKILND